MSPGEHVLEVSFAGYETVSQTWVGQPSLVRRHRTSMGSIRIPFTAKAGHTYRISYETDEENRRWKAFVSEFQRIDGPLHYGAAHGALAMTTPGNTFMASLMKVEALVKGGSARVQR
jgi:hypothetical protein